MPLDGYEDLAQARVDVASYILGYYCQVRPHHFNNYLTPVEKEKQFFSENLLEPVHNLFNNKAMKARLVN